MSSSEPPPSDDDTGPLHVDRVRAAAADRPEGRYDAPLSVTPRPVQRNRRPVVLTAAAIVAVVALGVLAWSFWPSSEESEVAVADNPDVTSAAPEAQAQDRVLSLVPRGYPAGACTPVVPPNGALTQVSCTENTDPGGPLVATYTLARDDGALETMFEEVVDTSAVVNCPGNIQSPGPWRRNAAPDQEAGTLVCGFQQGRPTIAWTTASDQLLSEIHSGPQGPNMVQLYTWWTSHS